MVKVLVVSTVGLSYQGIASVIYNYINNMNRTGMQFDFVSYENMDLSLKSDFERFGTVLVAPTRKRNIIAYVIALNRIMRRRYDVVHIHGNSGTMAIEAFLAKIHHVKKIIVHCHSTASDHPVINASLKASMINISTQLIACSNAAGKWLYGNSEYIILKNAIEVSRFQYNSIVREKCREELGIKNEYVIGHVGRFDLNKNQSFIIDVFAEFHKSDPCSKLLLVGDGPTFEKIRSKVEALEIAEAVMLLGRRRDVERLYQAMDILLFPSLWEGLPMVLIEAQASGLPCVVSTNVTKEAQISDKLRYIDIKRRKEWINEIVRNQKVKYFRNVTVKADIQSHGFDISKEAEKLRLIYSDK